MSALFKKLNIGLHRSIAILNAPETMEAEIATLEGVHVARTQ